ncbi:MAG: radical SAM protein [Eubacteriales bacterium]|nr:radical SAM protein [Eubacteriales bacterium]
MYYRLKNGFVLRGWAKLNAILIKRPENDYRILKSHEFNLLLLCDGETDFDNFELSQQEEMAREDFLHKEIIEAASVSSPLDEDQLYKSYPNRFVDSCFWSITGRCNFRCRHCYMDAPEGTLGELSHEDAVELIDQMADCGVLKVDITGGEPFVRKDFWQLIDYLQSKNITVGMIYTNGWMLTDEVLDEFEKRKLHPSFSISFDGIGWHDWMRGVKGAEQAALNALSLCKRRGFPMNVEMCLHKGNSGSLRETLTQLAKIGVMDVKCSRVSDTPLWNQNSEGSGMTLQEYVDAMVDYIPKYYEDGCPVNLILCDVAVLNKGKTEYEIVAEKRDGTEDCLNCHLCGSARFSCYISPEGRLLPCMPVTACKEQEDFARFQDIGLRACLSDSLYMQFVDKRVKDLFAVNGKCRACPYRLKCAGGCRAAALEQCGDLMGPDLHQCFLWENGYVEKLHQIIDEAIVKYCKKEDKEDEN